MKLSLALSTLSILLASTLIEAAPQLKPFGSQGGAIPRLQPLKVTPKKSTPTPPASNNAATLKPFGSNGAAIPKGNQAKGNQSKGNQNQNKGGNAAASKGATSAAATATSKGNNAAATSTKDVAAAAASQAKGASANDLQTSLTLDPGQVQPGLANDGQAVPAAGQVASLTSTNNFINFCATRPDLPLTNGQQILTGSCNPTIMGLIVPKSKMPSAKIISPLNLDTIAAGTSVTFKIKVRNMKTGNFVNAQQNYFSAPQQTTADGTLIAHSHITVNKISSFQDTEPQDPQIFEFFKGLNDAAVNDILSADATGGFDPGFYRACTINTAANHQPALVAVAQHASLDDCTYFQVTDGGADDTKAGAATTSSAAAAATATGKATLSPKGSNGAQVNVQPKKPTFSPPSRTAASANKGGRNRRRFNSPISRRRVD